MEINVELTANGNLRITMAAEERAELAEAMEEGRGFWGILADLFEPYACNGSYEAFDAGDGNPFVGLTSAPCIAESLTVEDDGTRTIEGRFWYFERYMLECPLETLATTGEVIFHKP